MSEGHAIGLPTIPGVGINDQHVFVAIDDERVGAKGLASPLCHDAHHRRSMVGKAS
jgi:hypothetical protein